jgi:hypothetical protein
VCHAFNISSFRFYPCNSCLVSGLHYSVLLPLSSSLPFPPATPLSLSSSLHPSLTTSLSLHLSIPPSIPFSMTPYDYHFLSLSNYLSHYLFIPLRVSDGYMGFDIAAVSAPIASGQKGFGSGRVSGVNLCGRAL